MLGGDHSIGFPCVRGIAQCTSKRIGIIHFDRHIDIQEKDLDEPMHTISRPFTHATVASPSVSWVAHFIDVETSEAVKETVAQQVHSQLLSARRGGTSGQRNFR
jgi:arginase family enzyme